MKLTEGLAALEEVAELDAVVQWLGAATDDHAALASALRGVLGELGD